MKHGCTQRQQSQIMAKSYILTRPHPQGHMMSVKYEEYIDELTVQVWVLYYHPNFKYCSYVYNRYKITDRRTDRRTIRLLNAPGRGIKINKNPQADLLGGFKESGAGPEDRLTAAARRKILPKCHFVVLRVASPITDLMAVNIIHVSCKIPL